jgi:RHS repeat-associated protein
MGMPGRSFSSGVYRYGFNGKENDNEVKGQGNQVAFEARIYDARLGRWLSVDPLSSKYPAFSGYNFAINNPNMFYDIDGRDVGVSITKNPSGGPGGTIVFKSTQYITGTECAQELADLSNAAFQKFKEANPNMKSGAWSVDMQMEFKVAKADDITRIQGATAGQMADNLIQLKSPTANSDNRANAGDKAGTKYGNGQLLNNNWLSPAFDKTNKPGSVSGNSINMFDGDNGRTSVHETLHNWGLGDRYSDISYENVVQQWFSKTGKVESTTIGKPTIATGVTHVGFEGTVMAGGLGFVMPQVSIDDLVNTALKTQASGGGTNFVMALKVDQTNYMQTSPVPQVKTSTQKYPGGRTWKQTSSKPTFKRVGS